MDPNTYVLKLKQELKDTITNLESIQKYLNTHSSSLNAKNKEIFNTAIVPMYLLIEGKVVSDKFDIN